MSNEVLRAELRFDTLWDVLYIPAPVRWKDDEWWTSVELGDRLERKIEDLFDEKYGQGAYSDLMCSQPDFDYLIDDSTGEYVFYMEFEIDDDILDAIGEKDSDG